MLMICTDLLPYEREALVNALRRDAASERKKALAFPQWNDYHLLNARMSVRILELMGYREEVDSDGQYETDPREK